MNISMVTNKYTKKNWVKSSEMINNCLKNNVKLLLDRGDNKLVIG